MKLALKMGSEWAADGLWLNLTWLSQEYWLPDEKLGRPGQQNIPESAWKLAGFPDVIFELGLATRDPDGSVYASGAKERFQWWFDERWQRQLAAQARMKKAPRDPKTGRLMRVDEAPPEPSGAPPAGGQPVEEKPPEPQRAPTGPPPEVHRAPPPIKSKEKRVESSILLDSKNSASTQIELIRGGAQKPAAPRRVPPGVPTVIAAYVDAWQGRYKAKADVTGKDAGIMARLTKDLGEARAVQLAMKYLEMNDGWFLEKRHDIPTLEANLAKVRHYADTGVVMTREDIRRGEKQAGTATLQDRIRRGEV